MGILLNNEQIYACYDIENWWHKSSNQLYEIDGPAGSGKTTLIRYFIDRIGLKLEDVLFVSYMGKAVSQMARNGLPARTIHSSIYDCEKVICRDEDGKIIYQPSGKPKKKLTFVLKDKIPTNPKLIVIDEAFMVPEKTAEDILSFGIPTIATGDTHQLPPVFGNPYFLNNPNTSLKQVMRQKEGDPIIYLSQELLHHRPLKEGVYKKSCVIPKKNLTDFMLKSADVIITGTNRLRSSINNLFRESFLDLPTLEYPNYGEKIICRRNDWSKFIRENGEIYLTNGLSGTVDYVDRETYNKNSINIDFKPDFTNKNFKNIKASIPYINMKLGTEESANFYAPAGVNLFEYAYAITTHLSQGSQYDNVVFLKEKNFFNNEKDYYRLLYTAVTRARESITYVV